MKIHSIQLLRENGPPFPKLIYTFFSHEHFRSNTILSSFLAYKCTWNHVCYLKLNIVTNIIYQ